MEPSEYTAQAETRLATLDLASFSQRFPFAFVALWGKATLDGYFMPSYYMGEDMRGYVVAHHDNYQLSQSTVHVSNGRAWQKLMSEVDPARDYYVWAEFGGCTPSSLLMVRHDAPYMAKVESYFGEIEDYIYLDEELLSEADNESNEYMWEKLLTVEDRLEHIQKWNSYHSEPISIFAARHSFPPSEMSDDFYNPEKTL